jgi:hypothetical protein
MALPFPAPGRYVKGIARGTEHHALKTAYDWE